MNQYLEMLSYLIVVAVLTLIVVSVAKMEVAMMVFVGFAVTMVILWVVVRDEGA